MAQSSCQMMAPVAVGDELPRLVLPPVSRMNLVLYCGASGDHNPIHVDPDFARSAGQPDVFAHGMLSMAWLGRLLTQWAPQAAIREYSVRFAAITRLGEHIQCTGKVVALVRRPGPQGEETCARIDVQTCNQGGQVKLAGTALVALAD